jgi:hypothetical protein
VSDTLICSICKQPVNLEESKTDEHGRAVHENCYIWTVELKKPRRRVIQMRALLTLCCRQA